MSVERMTDTVMFGEMNGQPRHGIPHREWLDDITYWCRENNIRTLVHAAVDRKF